MAARRQTWRAGGRQLRADVVLMQKFAEMAAKRIPQWEIVDYASDDKRHAERHGARARRAGCRKSARPESTVPIEQTAGAHGEARGARCPERRCIRCGCRDTSSAPK